MVSFNLKVLAKFGLCLNCSQKLHVCSLARARKFFATACQMLVLVKINTLLTCLQMLAKTILYPLHDNLTKALGVAHCQHLVKIPDHQNELFFSLDLLHQMLKL